MTIAQIADLYLQSLQYRDQAHQLSNRMLAKKFERCVRTISKIANGMPASVPQDEQDLIRACIAERDRLKSKASELSMPRLCDRYKVCHKTIERELVAMGVWGEAA
ncbi:MAG: hypothetical protein ACPHQ9_13045 [Marinobacter sp.]|uniref:hypothetical protein n=1 Tax=Marinobacter sp. TaxID=50741 RepID=UPI003C63985B